MSLNGSGVFNVNSAGQPVVSGTVISAAVFNALMQDIATALSAALYKDGQQLNAANQNMGGYKLTALGAGTAAGDSVRYEQIPVPGAPLAIASGGTASGTAADARTALAVLGTAGGNMTGGMNGALTTVASHATIADIFAVSVGNLVDWTGTATTTALAAAPQAGATRTLLCAGAAVFTAGANFIIDGFTTGQSYTAAAGDMVLVRAVTTTQFRLTIFPIVGVSKVVQVVEGTPVTTVSSTTATIPEDTSIPQISEGALLTSVTITPRKTTNRLRIEAFIPMSDASSTMQVYVAALFQDSNVDAIAVAVTALKEAPIPSITHEMAAGTTSATTFYLRIGAQGGTLFYNQVSGGSNFGSVAAVRIRVTEITP